MINKLKMLGAAAAVVLAPVAASAATVTMTADGGPYSLDDSNIVYRFNTDSFGAADDAGAAFSFEFSTSLALQATDYTITVNETGDFSDLVIAWSTDDILGNADDIALPLGIGISGTQLVPGTSYHLLTSYSGVSNGGNIDYRVSAVPVPAAGFLLIGALGALGVARRRKQVA